MEFWLNPSGMTNIWGAAEPNSPITVTTSNGDTRYGWANVGDGGFDIRPDVLLNPGDVITVTAGEGVYPVYIVFPEMSADSDSTSDQVFGHISYSDWNVEIHPDWEPMTTTLTDGAGNFSCAVPGYPPRWERLHPFH